MKSESEQTLLRVYLRNTDKQGWLGQPTAEALVEEPDIKALIDADRLNADGLAELLDPAGYLGAAGQLVDRALERQPLPPRKAK